METIEIVEMDTSGLESQITSAGRNTFQREGLQSVVAVPAHAYDFVAEVVLGSRCVVVVNRFHKAPVGGVVTVIDIQIGAAAYLSGLERESLTLLHVERRCHKASLVVDLIFLDTTAVVGYACTERPGGNGPSAASIERRWDDAAFKVDVPLGGVDDGSFEMKMEVGELVHLEHCHTFLVAWGAVVENDA